MKITPLVSGTLLALLLTGCGAASSQAGPEPAADVPAAATPRPEDEAAAAALAGMLARAEAGDWNGYVDEYYGEAHKFRSPDDRRALVARFEGRWGPPVIEALRRASGLTPTIEADGRALFAENGEPVFVLHKHESGRWTFHL